MSEKKNVDKGANRLASAISRFDEEPAPPVTRAALASERSQIRNLAVGEHYVKTGVYEPHGRESLKADIAAMKTNMNATLRKAARKNPDDATDDREFIFDTAVTVSSTGLIIVNSIVIRIR